MSTASVKEVENALFYMMVYKLGGKVTLTLDEFYSFFNAFEYRCDYDPNTETFIFEAEKNVESDR